jgi:hypothetical protein
MNEPHAIPDLTLWADTVQAAVTAIRMAGATQQMILLPGTDFTGAQTFISNGSAGNLSRVHNPDGTNTSLIFDVHKYLDADGSGTRLECVSGKQLLHHTCGYQLPSSTPRNAAPRLSMACSSENLQVFHATSTGVKTGYGHIQDVALFPRICVHDTPLVP